MDRDRLTRLLRDLRAGRTTVQHVARVLRDLPFSDLRFAKVDHHRELRTGMPEVILCERKTPEQCARIARRMAARGGRFLATRAGPDAAAAIVRAVPGAQVHAEARCVALGLPPPRRGRGVLIVTAGTSDVPVAEEAMVTARFLGLPVGIVHDVGVAGVHRLMRHLGRLRRARALIVVAGMEGALPSVVGGLVDVPVIAVPTSVGYGASFGGLAALLGMLNSCAPGVAVVNVDNGFGAAAFVAAMLRRR